MAVTSKQLNLVSFYDFRTAMAEYEKKLHAGDNFVESVRNVLATQSTSYSTLFKNCQKLPGYIRIFQEKPFKLMLGNYDMIRLGAEYFNRTDNSFMCIDSSGNFWTEKRKKNEPKKLNTAIVIPPIEKGDSPFPVFEQISESNKTIDFIVFLEYAWYYMRDAINNQDVKFPALIICDLAFAIIHSTLHIFGKIGIREYLQVSFNSLTRKENVNVSSKLAICENHVLPALLKSSRKFIGDKVLADTVIARYR